MTQGRRRTGAHPVELEAQESPRESHERAGRPHVPARVGGEEFTAIPSLLFRSGGETNRVFWRNQISWPPPISYFRFLSADRIDFKTSDAETDSTSGFKQDPPASLHGRAAGGGRREVLAGGEGEQ